MLENGYLTHQESWNRCRYSRFTYEDGSISSTIIASKTRVAPTTATSIPRLELMGAVIGVRLTSRIAKVLDVNMNDCVFSGPTASMFYGGFGVEVANSSLL